MSKLQVKTCEWIVVCDYQKAIVLDNVGDEVYPNLRIKEVRQQCDPRTSEQGTDRLGRFFASDGEVLSAAKQTDWHRETEQTFLRNLAHDLHAAGRERNREALGRRGAAARRRYDRQAWLSTHREALKAELAHDYIKLPVNEIEQRLFA
jgi:protein required for attachment to host cells